MRVTEFTECRASKKGPLMELIDLGEMPLNCFPLPEDPDPPKAPMKLMIGPESKLVQLSHSIDSETLYSEYWYQSGINNSMKNALKTIVDAALERVSTKGKDVTVLDIACNDGTLLSWYPSNFLKVGVDPSNIRPSNCDIYANGLWSKDLYLKYVGPKKATIVTAISVFYDLNDPVQFCADVADILEEDGIYILEMSYLLKMLEENSVETIVHEHLEYYSLTAIDYIMRKAKLEIEDVEFNDVNGGSFRLYMRHQGKANPTAKVQEVLQNEVKLQHDKLTIYSSFMERVNKNKMATLKFLEEQKKLGKLVIGYAASTKGNTIMAFYGIGPDLMPFVCDRNPRKHGRQTVTRIPIISEDEARKKKPNYLFIFAYHFMPEFLQRESAFLMSGGIMVSPIPHLTMFDKTNVKK